MAGDPESRQVPMENILEEFEITMDNYWFWKHPGSED